MITACSPEPSENEMLIRGQIQTKEFYILILSSPEDLHQKSTLLQEFLPILNLKSDIGWAFLAKEEYTMNKNAKDQSWAYFYHKSKLIVSSSLKSIEQFKSEVRRSISEAPVLKEPPTSN